jgi:hypothetical protein
MSQPENNIGVEPRVVQPGMRLTVSREPLGGDENFEFARRVLAGRMVVLRVRTIARCQGPEGEQGDGSPRSLQV